MTRLSDFIRSVLPADRSQLIFLAGVVCFIIGPRLRWWPNVDAGSAERLNTFLGGPVSGTLFSLLTVAAGMAGYYVCFWPGERPFRRVLLAVWFPGAVGWVLILCRFLYIALPSAGSVLQSKETTIVETIRWFRSIPWRAAPAFEFCFVGLVLIGIFCFRLALNGTSLPLHLQSATQGLPKESDQWRKIQMLVWIVIGPLIVAHNWLLFAVLTIASRLHAAVPRSSLWDVERIVGAIVLVGVAWLVLPEGIGEVLANAARWPGEKFILLSIAFPALGFVVASLASYGVDRVLRQADVFSGAVSPEFRFYFQMHGVSVLPALACAAFAEEIVFRGVLQPTFIDRYGLHRGILMIAIVWAAFHLPFDFSFAYPSDIHVVEQLVQRFLLCVGLGFVFGWLAVASRSVVPAAIAHSLYNLSVIEYSAMSIIRLACWLALAYVLFRYWPVASDEPAPVAPSITATEIAP